ncbi:unnamed protein product [Prorocentrum cordatum]|uniref:Uncharacterized protein n=1 Tax=Prorocentrum cordatum TaxID=2364126 RepID=A0ABN9TN11_9DINO|nr:unnamed protein product [Polarella glacialis]
MSGQRKRRTEGWAELQKRRYDVGRRRYHACGFRSAAQLWLERIWEWATAVAVAARIRLGKIEASKGDGPQTRAMPQASGLVSAADDFAENANPERAQPASGAAAMSLDEEEKTDSNVSLNRCQAKSLAMRVAAGTTVMTQNIRRACPPSPNTGDEACQAEPMS